MFDEPFDRAFSGIALRAQGADYRIFRVTEVLENSPATEAGIREGDIITAVNGTPAAELTLAILNEMLDKPVSYSISIRRNDQTIQVTLTPRRLI